MKVSDFLDVLGNYLQEDYSTSPVWTQAECFGYLKQVVRVFCDLTGIVDRNEIRLINGTTGEADVPKDFNSVYFTQHELRYLDIVDMNELDFVSGTWLGGTTGTPKASSVIGSGDGAVIRYVPVPTSVYDGGPSASPTAGLTLAVGGVYWVVTCAHGVPITTVGAGPATTPVIAGPSTFWDLTVSATGELLTAASTATTADSISLVDATSGSNDWLLLCTDAGVLYTQSVYTNYGIAVAAALDFADYQDFDSEYGVIVDAYATASTTSPTNLARLDSSIGVSLFARTSSETGMVWYKGSLDELSGMYSEVWLNDGFISVLVHGVMSLAFGHDGDGRDLDKAKLMGTIFTAECQAIKAGFQTRWA